MISHRVQVVIQMAVEKTKPFLSMYCCYFNRICLTYHEKKTLIYLSITDIERQQMGTKIGYNYRDGDREGDRDNFLGKERNDEHPPLGCGTVVARVAVGWRWRNENPAVNKIVIQRSSLFLSFFLPQLHGQKLSLIVLSSAF